MILSRLPPLKKDEELVNQEQPLIKLTKTEAQPSAIVESPNEEKGDSIFMNTEVKNEITANKESEHSEYVAKESENIIANIESMESK